LYGGRGITVCERWLRSFIAFLADMGQRPSPRHTLDRIDNNGPYTGPCPEYPQGNCRWATPFEQANNRRNNRLITWNDTTHSVSEWARLLNFKHSTLLHRLASGWSIEKTLTTALRRWPSQLRD